MSDVGHRDLPLLLVLDLRVIAEALLSLCVSYAACFVHIDQYLVDVPGYAVMPQDRSSQVPSSYRYSYNVHNKSAVVPGGGKWGFLSW